MNKLKYFESLLYIVLAIIVATYCLGLNYQTTLTPQKNYSKFENISHDKWVMPKAQILLSGLANFSNFVSIKWNDWQPESAKNSLFQIKVCDGKEQTVSVIPGKESVIPLNANCDPKILQLNYQGSFVSYPNDNRRLSVQIERVTVSSIFRVPIVSFYKIASLALLLVLTSIFITLTFKLNFVLPFSITSILSLYLNYIASYSNPTLSYWFTGLMFIFALGLFSARNSLVTTENKNWNLSLIVLVIIIALSAILRINGLNFGLPNIYHPDEFQKYLAVMRMYDNNDLNPRYFWHPSLLLYSTYLSNIIIQFIYKSNNFPDTLIFAGRVVSLLAGVLSVYLVYLIGKNMLSKQAGLISAFLLAVAPLSVTCSRYVKEDSLLTFFILLATNLVVLSAKKSSLKLLIIAGLVAGLSAAVKYSGAVSFFILWTYPWLNTQKIFPNIKAFKYPLIATCIVPLGFLIATPYAILDYQTFLTDFGRERDHMLVGHSSTITATSQLWLYHLKNSIWNGFGWIQTILAIFSFGFLLRAKPTAGLFLLSIFLLYYLPAEFVRAKPAPQPERYITPCLPILALAIALTFEYIKSFNLKSIFLVLILLATASSYHRSYTLASEIVPDTRDKMSEWLINNIPKEAKVIIDWEQYGPQFKNKQLSFNVEYLDPEVVITELSVNKLKEKNADYLVLSSLHYNRYFKMPNSSPAFRQVIREVFKNYPKIHEEKSKYGSYGFHNPDLTVLKLK
jgi:hypothetical protein